MIEAGQAVFPSTRPARWEVIGWVLIGLLLAASLGYGFSIRDDSFVSLVALVLVITLGLATSVPSPQRDRALFFVFFTAFSLRLLSTVLFHYAGRYVRDPFAGSPDAWNYHRWAVGTAQQWTEGLFQPLQEWYLVGSWDIGFYYILSAAYLVFGPSALVGRALSALFGALAAVLLCKVVRELCGKRAGDLAGIIYAIFPLSILWSGYSILRDSLVCCLMLAATYLALRILEGSRISVVLFFATLATLRFVRAYAAMFVLLALILALAIALLRTHRVNLRAVAMFVLAVVSVEIFFKLAGFPHLIGGLKAYNVERFILKPIDSAVMPEWRPPNETAAVVTPTATPPAASPSPAQSASGGLPGQPILRPSEPSIIGNTVRFFMGPFPWTGDLANAGGNWQLPAMWFWYAILPGAVLGCIYALRGRPALQVLMLTALALVGTLILVGRGNAVRHREMITPIMILGFVLFLEFIPRYRRAFVILYISWVSLVGAVMVYHRHTLKERGLITDRESVSRRLVPF